LSWQASSAAHLQTSSSSTSVCFPYPLSSSSITIQLFCPSASPSVTCLSTIRFVGHSRKPIYLTFETGLRLSDTDNPSALEASIQGDVNINTQKASTAQIHGITIQQLITSDKVSLFFSVVGNCSHVS
jgi:hypothetical protein